MAAILISKASKQVAWLAGKFLEAVCGLRERIEKHGRTDRSWTQFVWGKELWQLQRMGSFLPGLMMCPFSPSPLCPTAVATPVPCLLLPSASSWGPYSVPPCWGSAQALLKPVQA